MSTPRHRTALGIAYFETTKCGEGRVVFQVPENAQILIEALFHYRDQGAYLLHGYIVMPDHLHLILTPSETTSLEKAVGMVKGGSSHRIHKERGHKMEIWQKGFYDWTIRDADDWRTKVEYIRQNPVRAKVVSRPEEWPYSSGRAGFVLDPMPARCSQLSSGAKAPLAQAPAPGLKPRPPKERTSSGEATPQPKGLKLQFLPTTKAPTPKTASPTPQMQRLQTLATCSHRINAGAKS